MGEGLCLLVICCKNSQAFLDWNFLPPAPGPTTMSSIFLNT